MCDTGISDSRHGVLIVDPAFGLCVQFSPLGFECFACVHAVVCHWCVCVCACMHACMVFFSGLSMLCLCACSCVPLVKCVCAHVHACMRVWLFVCVDMVRKMLNEVL